MVLYDWVVISANASEEAECPLEASPRSTSSQPMASQKHGADEKEISHDESRDGRAEQSQVEIHQFR